MDFGIKRYYKEKDTRYFCYYTGVNSEVDCEKNHIKLCRFELYRYKVH